MKNEEFASFSFKLHGDSSFLVYHSSFSLCNLQCEFFLKRGIVRTY